MTFRDEFRVLVLETKHGDVYERTVSYVAVALEQYTCTSGDTLEECRENIEYLLVAQRALMMQFPDSPPIMCAPEDYQRLRNSGDWHEPVDPKWAAFCGRNRVVCRWDIDLRKTRYKIVDAPDQAGHSTSP